MQPPNGLAFWGSVGPTDLKPAAVCSGSCVAARRPGVCGGHAVRRWPGSNIPQRKSSRLADKTKNNHGKGAIEVAQDFVVKKLGHLFLQAGKQATNKFEFFA